MRAWRRRRALGARAFLGRALTSVAPATVAGCERRIDCPRRAEAVRNALYRLSAMPPFKLDSVY